MKKAKDLKSWDLFKLPGDIRCKTCLKIEFVTEDTHLYSAGDVRVYYSYSGGLNSMYVPADTDFIIKAEKTIEA